MGRRGSILASTIGTCLPVKMLRSATSGILNTMGAKQSVANTRTVFLFLTAF